jgi:hypothetical protein
LKCKQLAALPIAVPTFTTVSTVHAHLDIKIGSRIQKGIWMALKCNQSAAPPLAVPFFTGQESF